MTSAFRGTNLILGDVLSIVEPDSYLVHTHGYLNTSRFHRIVNNVMGGALISSPFMSAGADPEA
jgi:hypothetical protein